MASPGHSLTQEEWSREGPPPGQGSMEALPAHTHTLPRAAGSGGSGTTASWTTTPCPSGTSGVVCPVTSVLPTSAKMGVLSFSKVSWGRWEELGSLPAATSDPPGPAEESKRAVLHGSGQHPQGQSPPGELPKDRAGPIPKVGSPGPWTGVP